MKKNSLTDGELLSLYRNGDEQAFSELLDRHKDKVYTVIYLIVKDRQVAEDLMQEVFIKVIMKVKSNQYQEQGKLVPWILRMANNLAIDKFRKTKRYPTMVTEDGSDIFNKLEFSERSIEDKYIQEDTYKSLKRYIKQLPDVQRQVLVMRHYMDMSFIEIAEATNVSLNTALGRMRYALINLRRKFERNNEYAYDKKIYRK